MAKASPASNEGAPHWKGHGTLILQNQKYTVKNHRGHTEIPCLTSDATQKAEINLVPNL